MPDTSQTCSYTHKATFTHTYTHQQTHIARTHKYTQPVAICFAMFDPWCYDFEIKRQHYFNRTSFLCYQWRELTSPERLGTAWHMQQRVKKTPGYFYAQIRNGVIIISLCITCIRTSSSQTLHSFHESELMKTKWQLLGSLTQLFSTMESTQPHGCWAGVNDGNNDNNNSSNNNKSGPAAERLDALINTN